jgi:hypothetical protein
MPAATTSVSGYLTSTDWTTFNGKQAAGSYVTVGGALGTPSSGTLTNATGLPVGGITATGTPSSTTYLRGDGTWASVSASSANNLAGGALGSVPYQLLSGSTVFLSGNTTTTPQFLTSTGIAGLATAPTYTGSTGSGNVVLATSPTLVTPALGTPSSGTLTNCTFPTLNQNTTGTAAGLSATLAVASGGTGASTLTANNVLLGNGTSAIQAVAPGTSGNVLTSNGSTWSSSALPSSSKILQVVQSNVSATFSTSSTSMTDITNMAVTITPKFSTSTIMVVATVLYGGQNYNYFCNLLRGASAISQGSGSSGTNCTSVLGGITNTTYQMLENTISFLDSPATTSATTYKLQVSCQSGGTFYLNRSARDGSSDGRGTSSITVYEVAA